MPYQLDSKLVVGVSSRALFDLEEENAIFEKDGLEAYIRYQQEHENDILKPGTAFPLVKALHNLQKDGEPLTEIIIMSRNSADTSLRIFNSIEAYGLNITRAALSGGASITPYLNAFRTDLFLSANESDVQEAINAGVAAGIICSSESLNIDPGTEISQIRIAFDGDAVIFSSASPLMGTRSSSRMNPKRSIRRAVWRRSRIMRRPTPGSLCRKVLSPSCCIPSPFCRRASRGRLCRSERLL